MASFTTTYTDLVSDLQDYVEDDSNEFVAEIPNIINRAEDRVRRDMNLSVFNEIDTAQSMVGSTATITRPTGALKILYIRLTASNTFLERRSKDFLDMYTTATEEIPKYFAEDTDSTTLQVAPIPDSAYAYDIRYLKVPAKLVSSTNETNWLTDNVGDLLMMACLIEAEEFLKAPEMLEMRKLAYGERLANARIEFEGLEQTAFKPKQPMTLNVR